MVLNYEKLRKKILTFFLLPLASLYLSKDRKYNYEGLKLVIKKGVFHPGLFFSTKLFANFLDKLELKNQLFLELGAGSGLISLVAARKGAMVTSTDINQTAISNLKLNAQLNNSSITVIYSDLFSDIPENILYNYIFINPPYYAKDPQNEAENAWYCGSEFQYFQRLFFQLKTRNGVENSAIYMILSEDCDILAIEKVAAIHGFVFELEEEKKVVWEWNYIFKISLET